MKFFPGLLQRVEERPWVLLFPIAAFLLVHEAFYWRYTVDDAWITFRYSNHLAAAVVIARRNKKFSERTPRYRKNNKKDYGAFFLPERNRKKHVWFFWSQIKKVIAVYETRFLMTKSQSLKSKSSIQEIEKPSKNLERNSLMRIVGSTA